MKGGRWGGVGAGWEYVEGRLGEEGGGGGCCLEQVDRTGFTLKT